MIMLSAVLETVTATWVAEKNKTQRIPRETRGEFEGEFRGSSGSHKERLLNKNLLTFMW